MDAPEEGTEEEIAAEIAAIVEAVNRKLAQGGAGPLGATDLAWAHWRIRVCDLVVLLRAMGQDDATIEAAIFAGVAKRFDPALADVSPPLTLSFEGDQWDAASAASQ